MVISSHKVKREGLKVEQTSDGERFTVREGEEPAGEVPLELFDEDTGDSGPFEQVPASVPQQEARTLNPIAPVELVRLAMELLQSNKVFMKKYPNARGMFYADTIERRGWYASNEDYYADRQYSQTEHENV